ncbi:hypothetical protein RR42_s3168 [Cupriavidus basilensis]|uniref:Uncharacterized protein n=1 Tax=Cupriavidus basilensis TaxID=68895 RepID=A0A0C4YS45_9BURK|nr:hypothetical protein RR42_s3168 [Cupriavidus basilensis]
MPVGSVKKTQCESLAVYGRTGADCGGRRHHNVAQPSFSFGSAGTLHHRRRASAKAPPPAQWAGQVRGRRQYKWIGQGRATTPASF